MTNIEDLKDAMNTAIQMEKKGYAFYQKCAAQTRNEFAARFFTSIAGDELVHLRTFQKMFKEELGEEEFKEVLIRGKKFEKLPVFPKNLEKVKGVDPGIDEIEALGIAMDSEQSAIKFYGRMAKACQDDNARKIIKMIIKQEEQHYLLLTEELDYLNNTGDWYDLGPLGV